MLEELAEAHERVRVLERRIADLESSHQALQQDSKLISMSVAALSEGVVVADQEGRFLAFNDSAERIVGKGPAPPPAEAWPDEYGLFDAETGAPVPPNDVPLFRALRGEGSEGALLFVRNERRPAGVYISCSARTLRDDGDRIVGAVVSFQDITQRRRTEALLQKFHAAAELSTASIFIVDAGGIIEYANPRSVQMFGHRLEDMLERPFFELAGEGLSEVTRVWSEVQRGGFRGNMTAYHKDGGEILLTANVTPIRDDAGNATHWLAVLEDTTERQRVEREKAEMEARVRRLVDSNIIGVLLSRTDGRIDDANDAFLEIVGYSRADLANGLNWRELTAPGEDEKVQNAVRELLTAGAATPFEKRYIHKDGRPVPVLVGVARVGESDQNVAFVLDLTEQKRTEGELKQIAAELQRSNADLQHFAYIVSHDLQEPLRMVSGFLQLLTRRYQDQLDAEAMKLIGYAVEGAASMQTLIRDLLEYARVDLSDRGGEPTAAAAAYDTAMANLRAVIDETSADVACGALPSVRVDAVQLGQVFQNLIGNALKFRRPGTRPRVRVSARRHNGEWIFSVKDNGVGIEPANFDKVFTMFQRLNPRSQYSGTGMGLAITRRIVDRHGGRVWVESSPGKGSTFFFSLPA